VTRNVFVVQEEPTGRWIAGCCNSDCGFGMHTVADTGTEAEAQRAATEHRRELAAVAIRPSAAELEPAALRRKLARIAQMAAAWEQKFPDTIRTAAVVEAIRIVIQEQQ
jgi:hypothetical protein